MTIQGHPAFVIHKGPPGSRLLSENAYWCDRPRWTAGIPRRYWSNRSYDKHGNSSTAKYLYELGQGFVFIYKSSKRTRYIDNDLIERYSPAGTWNFKSYQERCRVDEKIRESNI